MVAVRVCEARAIKKKDGIARMMGIAMLFSP